MDDQNENFDQLRRLMALKKHEMPPSGYFNRFPGEVMSQIRSDRRAKRDSLSELDAQAPWLMRLWGTLAARPLFTGAFGGAVCSLMLAGIYFTEKPAASPGITAQRPGAAAPFIAAAPHAVAPSAGSTLLLAATNLTDAPPNLFDLVQPLQVAPVSLQQNH